MKERTCVIIKPDGVEKILLIATKKILENNLFITDRKELYLTKDQIKEQYKELTNDACYGMLEEFMLSKPIIVMIVEGENAIEKTQSLIGTFQEGYIPRNTIRGDHLNYKGIKDIRVFNLIQSSETQESAQEDINRYFPTIETPSKTLQKKAKTTGLHLQ